MRRLSTFELLLLGMFAALVIVSHVALRFPVKAPGHSGVVWMALLVTASAVVPRPGAATTCGLISGLLAGFLGLGDKGTIDTVLSYLAAGVGVDLVRSTAGFPVAAGSFVLAGVVGNLTKFTAKLLLDLWIGIPAGFVALGRGYPVVTHLAFGAAGGYLGYLVVAALRRAGFFTYLAERR